MLIRQLFDATSSTYTYLLGDEASRKAILIDPVFEQFGRDAALLRELDLDLVATLETHVHADHVTAGWLHKEAHGSQIIVSRRAGTTCADRQVDGGDVVRFGNASLEVRPTPGHTKGCVTYVTEDHAMGFTGDALLIRGTGRTDFQEGSASALYHSILQEIFTLPDACLLYPAHDYAGRTVTTVAEERAFNVRVGGEANERDFTVFMANLHLPHPKRIDEAVPANLRCGRPERDDFPSRPTWGPIRITYAGVTEIDPSWVAENRERVVLVDVRELDERTGPEGHIEGSLAVPLGTLTERLGELPIDRPIVAVCRSGRRSAQATILLRNAGRADAANLTGGMLRWNALGLPIAPVS